MPQACSWAFIALDADDSASRVVFQIKNIIIAKEKLFHWHYPNFWFRHANQIPGGRCPWNCMLHFLAIEACSTATICPFICPSSAAVCLSPPTKNAAGQKTTTAAAVAQPSLVRWLSCAPDNVAALAEIDWASSASLLARIALIRHRRDVGRRDVFGTRSTASECGA
jgi:hypothetical protein